MTDVQVGGGFWAVEIEATTDLDVPASRAWEVLVDTPRYHEWNPFVTRFVGAVARGAQVEVELTLPGRKPQRMRPRIVDVQHGRSYTWKGTVGLPGVLDGVHRFEVEPLGASRCRLIQRERLRGALVPAFRSLFTGPTPVAFESLNEALARRVHDA